MSLKEKIQEDLNKYLKENKILEISVLRLLLAAILNKEKEKRYKISQEKADLTEKDLIKESQLNDQELIEVLNSEIKKRRETIEFLKKGKRDKEIFKEEEELRILENYLPEQLKEEELKVLVSEAIKKIGALSIKDMGKVMAELVPKIKGRADLSLVSKIVKEYLEAKND
jgi:uncharacterized protein YqeY